MKKRLLLLNFLPLLCYASMEESFKKLVLSTKEIALSVESCEKKIKIYDNSQVFKIPEIIENIASYLTDTTDINSIYSTNLYFSSMRDNFHPFYKKNNYEIANEIIYEIVKKRFDENIDYLNIIRIAKEKVTEFYKNGNLLFVLCSNDFIHFDAFYNYYANEIKLIPENVPFIYFPKRNLEISHSEIEHFIQNNIFFEYDFLERALLIAKDENTITFLINFLANYLNINFINNDGYTLLHYATNENHSTKVNLLLEYGADPTIRNKEDNLTSIEVAALFRCEAHESKNNADIATNILKNLLAHCTTNLNKLDEEEYSLLDHVLLNKPSWSATEREKYLKRIPILLEYGAKTNRLNIQDYGKTFSQQLQSIRASHNKSLSDN